QSTRHDIRDSTGSVKHQLNTTAPGDSAVELALDNPRKPPTDIPSQPPGSVKHQLDTSVPGASAVELVLDNPREPAQTSESALGVSSTSLTQAYPAAPQSSWCSTIPGAPSPVIRVSPWECQAPA